MHGENVVTDLNVAAHAHANWSQFVAPEDTGFLRANILVTQEATEGNLQATVQSRAPYSAAVNYGHATPSGGFVPGQGFWEDGIEVAKDTLARRAKERKRSSGSSRRAFVSTSFDNLVG